MCNACTDNMINIYYASMMILLTDMEANSPPVLPLIPLLIHFFSYPLYFQLGIVGKPTKLSWPILCASNTRMNFEPN